MATTSPSTTWTSFFDDPILSSQAGADLFWSESLDNMSTQHNDMDPQGFLLDQLDTHSSAASTISEFDGLPASSVHHFPAWSTAGKIGKAGGPSRMQGSGNHKNDILDASPCDPASPSGLSDRSNNDNVLLDDLWFVPSPESGAVLGAHAALQRKKRMHFAKQLPSHRTGNGGQVGFNNTLTSKAALKACKSVPNFDRRVSSGGYTARLENLLAEMGWPSQKQHQDTSAAGNDFDGPNSDVHANNEGDDTIQDDMRGRQVVTSELEHDTRQPRAQGRSGTSVIASSSSQGMSSAPSTQSLSSSAPLISTDSALYKRRADSRDGNMPAPVPVSVPRWQESTSGGGSSYPDGGAQSSSLPAGSSAVSAFAQQRAAELLAQQQRLQHMVMAASASASSLGRTQSYGTSPPGNSSNSMLLASSSSSSSSSMQQHTSGGKVTSPATGRPNTASSGSNMTELNTPITPFLGMSLNSAQTNHDAALPSWNGAAGPTFAFTPSMARGSNDFPLMGSLSSKMAEYKDAVQPDPYIATLQNSLGLYNVGSEHMATAAISPADVLAGQPTFSSFNSISEDPLFGFQSSAPLRPDDPPHTAELFTQHNHHQRLIFMPNQQKIGPVGTSVHGQRPRAGTAMASLGGEHASPRHMRSTPNLHLSPSPSQDGAHRGSGSASMTNTPIKTIRKIASNKRLTNVRNATPESPSMQLLIGNNVLPTSPASPSKRSRGAGGGMLSTSVSMGNLSGRSGGGGFEFINYGIEDADELCSAVAPSGSYKVPLRGFGEEGDEEGGEEGGDGGLGDNEDDEDGSAGTDNDDGNGSPRRRRPRSSTTNRNGPRWADAPPVPSLSCSVGVDAPEVAPGTRQIKRQKSEASMMLAGRRKSPSMSNLRRRDQ